MTGEANRRLTPGQRVGYAVGDLGINLYFISTATYLLYFYTDVFGIPAAVAASWPEPLPNWAPKRPPAAAPPRVPMVCLVPPRLLFSQAAAVSAMAPAAMTTRSFIEIPSLKMGALGVAIRGPNGRGP